MKWFLLPSSELELFISFLPSRLQTILPPIVIVIALKSISEHKSHNLMVLECWSLAISNNQVATNKRIEYRRKTSCQQLDSTGIGKHRYSQQYLASNWDTLYSKVKSIRAMLKSIISTMLRVRLASGWFDKQEKEWLARYWECQGFPRDHLFRGADGHILLHFDNL